MTQYTKEDTIDSLSTEQLVLMANSDHQTLIQYIEENTIFDAQRIRLLLEMGAEEAKRRLNEI